VLQPAVAKSTEGKEGLRLTIVSGSHHDPLPRRDDFAARLFTSLTANDDGPFLICSGSGKRKRKRSAAVGLVSEVGDRRQWLSSAECIAAVGQVR
jgi:hypothetical protein